MKTRKTLLSTCGASIAALALSLGAIEAHALDVYLVAKEGTIALPGGGTMPVWGFVEEVDGDFATIDSGPVTSLPGPEIRVPVGDTTLVVHVFNALVSADGGEPISIVIPGQTPVIAANAAPVWDDGTSGPRTSLTQRVRSFAPEAAPDGGQATYTFTVNPGTHLYQSGTHPQVQVQMGLYGAMIQDSAPGEAYPGVGYGEELTLLYSELDPALHAAVVANDYGPLGSISSTLRYAPRYFLINGVAYEAGNSPVTIGGSGRVLVRLLNAGLQSRAPTFQGLYVSTVAEDGYAYANAREEYNVFLPAGKTHDAIVTPTCAAGGPSSTVGTVFGVYDATLALTNDGGTDAGGQQVRLALADGEPGGGAAYDDPDLIAGICDNCSLANNPDQRDSDSDGYGDSCDADYDNSGFVDFIDFGIFRTQILFTSDPRGDFDNSGGLVDFTDFGILRTRLLFNPPGPSGVAN